MLFVIRWARLNREGGIGGRERGAHGIGQHDDPASLVWVSPITKSFSFESPGSLQLMKKEIKLVRDVVE
jgi:hypothetical protein